MIDNSSQPSAVDSEEIKQRSFVDVILWILAIFLLFASLFVNQYLPQYFVAANELWVRIAAIFACIAGGIGLIYATHQGKAFVSLLKSARLELRRVTWPTKPETITASWQVALMVGISMVVLWVFDQIFDKLIRYIVG